MCIIIGYLVAAGSGSLELNIVPNSKVRTFEQNSQNMFLLLALM
jgi:hypothetical protein